MFFICYLLVARITHRHDCRHFRFVYVVFLCSKSVVFSFVTQQIQRIGRTGVCSVTIEATYFQSPYLGFIHSTASMVYFSLEKLIAIFRKIQIFFHKYRSSAQWWIYNIDSGRYGSVCMAGMQFDVYVSYTTVCATMQNCQKISSHRKCV